MRAAGVVITVISSGLIGLCFSYRLSQSLAVCEELLLVMKYVRDEIAVNRTPTSVIFSRLKTDFNAKITAKPDLYRAFEDRLSLLNEEERGIFQSFSETVGKGDAEVQRSRFDALYGRFSELVAAKRARAPKSKRLYVALSLFFGALVIIILI